MPDHFDSRISFYIQQHLELLRYPYLQVMKMPGANEDIHLYKQLPFGQTGFELGIDLGGGLGETAYYLAKQGLKMDVIDFSPVAFDWLTGVARAENLPITCHLKDFTVTPVAKNYDLVVMTRVLQAVDPLFVDLFMADWKNYTRAGGYHVMVAHTDSPEMRRQMNGGGFLVTTDWLRFIYQDWEILYLEERCSKSVDPVSGLRPHFFDVVARKPS